MDPFGVGSVDVARGPGSRVRVHAFGGVISVQTPRPVIGGPWKAVRRARLAVDFRIAAAAWKSKRGTTGAVLVQAHARKVEDYDGPSAGPELRLRGSRGPGKVDQTLGGGLLSLGWQSDFGRNIERPRNNSASTRFYSPFENSHRATASYEVQHAAGLDLVRVQGFFGAIKQRTDQDRVPTATVAVRSCGRRRGQRLLAARLGEQAGKRTRLNSARTSMAAPASKHTISRLTTTSRARKRRVRTTSLRTRRAAWTPASSRRQMRRWRAAACDGSPGVDFVSTEEHGRLLRGQSPSRTRPYPGLRR